MMSRLSVLLVLCFVVALRGMAQQPQKGIIYVNEDVTTHIVMPENIKLVDLSTQRVVGNQCADNMLRIKPIVADTTIVLSDELLGYVSIIGESNIAQFEIRYVKDPQMAESMRTIVQKDLASYKNPAVTMPESLMAKYAWAVYCSGRKYNNVTNKKNGLTARVNNIYSVGDYFFIDFSIENRTNIPYDIEEIKLKLADKKEAKATNVQTLELTPVYNLNLATRFRKAYRNVLVVEKLTFPNEKVLTLEISEDQISGRVISLNIEYDDVLNADGFHPDLLRSLESNHRIHISN